MTQKFSVYNDNFLFNSLQYQTIYSSRGSYPREKYNRIKKAPSRRKGPFLKSGAYSPLRRELHSDQ
ncbi:hypothetical protein AD929_12170 [Gluconobacter potus]|uniref:Uncharacterized protein n=1 Tax=Gluconobacter potus TaxID=2724927 RepID=A0A149QT75_9PROT|nr:hypothetical protein AD929_12170 [Gluconobacter potus]